MLDEGDQLLGLLAENIVIETNLGKIVAGIVLRPKTGIGRQQMSAFPGPGSTSHEGLSRRFSCEEQSLAGDCGIEPSPVGDPVPMFGRGNNHQFEGKRFS